jgi:hypothetical protein
MRSRLLTPLLAGGVLSLALWTTTGKMSADSPDGPPGPPDKGPPGERGGPPGKRGTAGKAEQELRHAYDVLSEVSGPISQSKDQLPPGTGQLLTKAKDIYRAGQKCMKEGDRQRASELGQAANEAGRGLKHVLRASLSPASDLPPPPEGTDGPPPRREGRRAKGPAGDDGDGPPPRPGPRGKGRPYEQEGDAPPPPPNDGRRPNGPPPPPDGVEAFQPPALDGFVARGPRPRPGDEEEDGPPPSRRNGRFDKGPPDGPDRDTEPWQHARTILRHVRDRLDEVTSETATGKAFLDGARNAYGLARRAYLDGDYRKATEFGCAAEAWTHVGEHLARAGYQGAELKTRRDAAPPPPPEGRRGNRPPPPPPGDDGPGDDRGPGARPGRESGPPMPPDGQRDGRRRPPPGDGGADGRRLPPDDGGPGGRRPAPPPPPEE